MEWIVFVMLLGSACTGSTGAAPPIVGNTARPADSAKPAPMAELHRISSVEDFCAALDAEPAVRPEHGDERVKPGCIFDHVAWSMQAEADAQAIGPFSALRVLPITTARGASACALFVKLDDTWYASDDAVTDCYIPGEDYEQISGSFENRETRALIQTSAGHDPCGCDEDLWVGQENMTVCGVTTRGAPACTRPIETQRSGATSVMRTWALTGRELALSPWWYGTHAGGATAAHELADDEDGGGPAQDLRLPF